MATVSNTPLPPYYAVIFTSIRTDGDNGYGDAAKQMLELPQSNLDSLASIPLGKKSEYPFHIGLALRL